MEKILRLSTSREKWKSPVNRQQRGMEKRHTLLLGYHRADKAPTTELHWLWPLSGFRKTLAAIVVAGFLSEDAHLIGLEGVGVFREGDMFVATAG
jgi:hypothetical protein